MPFRFVLVSLAVASCCRSAVAQWPRELESELRVRVTVPEAQRQRGAGRGHSLRGTIARLDPDTLYLRITDSLAPLPIPRAWIQRVDVSRGIPSRVANAARVGLLWAAIGALEFVVLNGVEESTGLSAGEAALLGAGVGLTVGATVGALHPTERWKRVRLAPQVEGRGSAALSLSIQVAL